MSVLFALNNADLIEIVVILIITALAGIGQWLAKMRQPPPPVEGRAKPAPVQRPVPTDVADEIEKFLRRAQERRGDAKPAPVAKPQETRPQATMPAGETRLAQETSAAREAKQVRERAKPARKPVTAEAAPTKVVELNPLNERVEEHVQKYLNPEEFSRRGDQLGKGVVDEVARDIDQHLHQVFDHQMGQLAADPSARTAVVDVSTAELTAAAEGSAATEWDMLFAGPDSIRQAVVLSEIMNRPEHRWS